VKRRSAIVVPAGTVEPAARSREIVVTDGPPVVRTPTLPPDVVVGAHGKTDPVAIT